jgi:energy-converting hydrogenase A subunit R
MLSRVYVSDCEGPITKNDNAFEITAKFVPNGDKFFSIMSKYDDVLADVFKKPGYNAGDTLKLILSFLKAHDVTNQKMKDFSGEKIKIIPKAGLALNNIRHSYDDRAFIVSTSYEHYINALCNTIDFPVGNTYSTKVNIDKYGMTADEKIELQKLTKEISSMPMMNIPDSNVFSDFSEEDKKNIERLDEIVWKVIPGLSVGKVLKEVKPVGGHEKANAVKDIVAKLKTDTSQVMYVGDSITDAEAFKLVNKYGGVAVSFNGNRYAVNTADLGIMAEDAGPVEKLAYAFKTGGRKEAMQYAPKFGFTVLKEENKASFAEESNKFRKTVRTEEIGRLG